ncbi:MAG: GNAT family N-acetyltransferase [Defluviitaleaceae bacterium]|nr:GNAT family N-acetyltransferase [Defluviitaleaceae bacterium]
MPNIITFSKVHVEDARSLALADYSEARAAVLALPHIDEIPLMYYDEFVENGLGVALYDGKKMLGFLCCQNPWQHAFGSAAVGTFVPGYARGAVNQNKENIYKKLYQAAAEIWTQKGIAYHAISVYAHDAQATNAFFALGFGLRCVDAVRPMSNFDCSTSSEISYRELEKADVALLRDMRRALSTHLGESPCFYKMTDEQHQRWLTRAESRDSRLFAATTGAEIAAFVEVADDGESFASYQPSMQNICGAFCAPEHRGKDIMQGLLNFAITTLKADGYTSLGVDFESYNLSSNAFWLKYFTAYNHTVFRRIDECGINF